MNARNLIVAALVLGVIGAVAYPIYAHCGKCVESAKGMVKMMDQNKLTLAKAIEAAEAHTKGKAVGAMAKEQEKDLVVDVYCVAGDKILLAHVDGKTGKVTKADEVKELGGHEHKEGEPKKGG